MKADMMSLDAEKQALRVSASAARKLAQEAMPDAAQIITQFSALLSERFSPNIIAAYWPIRTEIDPIPLLEALADQGADTCLPVTPEDGKPLRFHRWQIGEALADGPYKTKEPFASAPVMIPDLILAPLLAFDAGCWRLGYGGGFYDRTLAALEEAGHHASVVGIAYDESCVDQVPTGPYDRALSAVLTPTGLISPNS